MRVCAGAHACERSYILVDSEVMGVVEGVLSIVFFVALKVNGG